jgi:hypothetical protein
MADSSDIANILLTFLGEQTITALSDDNARANAINAVYEHARDVVLDSHEWNCAQIRDTLTVDGTAPEYGFLYRYAVPSDCLKVVSVYEGLAENGGYAWRVEDGYILIDYPDEIQITYTKQVTTVDDMSMRLREAIAAKIGMLAAKRITGKINMVEACARWYAMATSRGVEVDAEEMDDPPAYTDTWISARN